MCGECLAALAGPVRTVAPRYGTLPVLAAGEHRDVLRELLVAHKDRGRHDLAPLLGLALARAVDAAVHRALPGVVEGAAGTPAPTARPVFLVPVPSTRKARRRRHADHVAVLADHAVRDLRQGGIPAQVAPVLRVAGHHDQVGAGRAGRRRNVRGTLHLREDVPEAHRARLRTGTVVVVDDVCTTGATLAESVRALRVGRIPTQRVATVGTTPGAPCPPAVGGV